MAEEKHSKNFSDGELALQAAYLKKPNLRATAEKLLVEMERNYDNSTLEQKQAFANAGIKNRDAYINAAKELVASQVLSGVIEALNKVEASKDWQIDQAN